MTTVTGKLLGDVSPQRVEMKASLVDVTGKPTVGYVASLSGELVKDVTIHPDQDGTWEADLTPNALVTSDAGDTLWAIQEGRALDGSPNLSYVVVPASGSHWVGSIRADLSDTQTGQGTVVYLAGQKGDPGDDGASAYDIWLANGHTGTEQDFLDSLKGADGQDGTGGGGGSDAYTDAAIAAEVTRANAAYDPAGAASSAQAAAATDATGKVATHSADTTDVHGIADTAALETKTGAQSKVNTAISAEVTRANAAYDAAGAAAAAQSAAVATAATDATSKASAAQSAATAAAATDAAGKVATHAGATDPHGDRAYTDTQLAAHAADSTDVHGIADTAALETQTGAQTKATAAQTAATSAAATDATGKVAAHRDATDPHGDRAAASSALATHAADTTDVHGIADTSVLETTTGAQSKATAAQSAATTAAATDATGKVTAHSSASDPHGDRAWADSKFATQVTTTALNGYVDDTVNRIAAVEGGTAYLTGGHYTGPVEIVSGSLSAMRLFGRRTSAGAPTTGTWVAGDLVPDSAGAWWLCTTGGTPGTWVNAPATPINHASTHAAAGSDPLTLSQSQVTGLAAALAAALPLAGGTMTGTTNATLGTAGTAADASLVSGDTFDRYRRYADGKLEWGSGSAARDTVLYRDGADSLRTDDSLTVAGTLRTPGGMTWRRRNLPDLLIADSLSTETLTTPTTATNASPQLSTAVQVVPNTGPYQYCGAGDFQFGASSPDTNYYLPTSKIPHAYTTAQATWSVEWCTNAPRVEVRFKYISAASMYRLVIDGRPIGQLLQTLPATVTLTPGNQYRLLLDLGSAKPRRWRLDLATFPFGGVYIEPAYDVWRPATQGGRLAILGDSISDGSAGNTGGGQGTWFKRFARMIGCNDDWDQAKGSTGYVAAGSSATFGDRVSADVVAYNPDRVIVFGGYNDTAGTLTAIGNAAASVFSTLKTGLPNAQIIVIGCWAPTASPATSLQNIDATLRTTAAAAGLPFISPQTGAIYNAAGTLIQTDGPWITSANVSSYIYATDSTHPTDAGHAAVARRVYDAYCALLPA